METTVFGMNGTGDWGHPDHRPKSYRETAFKLFPDAPTPFTYVLSKLPTKTVRDPEYKIFEDRLPVQTAKVKTVTSGGGSVAVHAACVLVLYTATDDAALYLSNPTAAFKVGDLLRLEKAGFEAVRVTVITDDDTMTVTRHWGWSSATDDYVLATQAIATNDLLRWSGSADPEGNGAPKALSKRTTVVSNYTEIFKDSASLTGTAAATDFRPMKDQFSDLKQQALLRHMIKLEWAFLHGKPEETDVTNSFGDTTTVRSTGGVYTFLDRAGYVTDFSDDGISLEELEDGMRDAFKYGSKKKLGVIGYQALNVINRLVRENTVWNWTGEAKEAKQTYGLTVFTLRTPFGELELVPHALLAESDLYTEDLYILDTKYLEYVTLPGRDTKWHPNAEANDEDSKRGYWQTECGLRLAMPECHAAWTGIGNVQAA